MRSESPPTLRLASPVTAMFEMVAPHSTSDWKPETGGSFFRRVPAGQEPGVEDSYPRCTWILVAPPATSRMRSSLEASPMKYRPPVRLAPLSTLHVVSPGPTSAVRKHPSLSDSSTISNRGAKTMYIFRQSAAENVPPFLSVRKPSGRLMRYFVSLSPPVNRMLRFAPNVTPCVPSPSWNDRTVMISPLPNLPMTCAGGGLVLKAMVNVLPEAVASMTLDWSGPT